MADAALAAAKAAADAARAAAEAADALTAAAQAAQAAAQAAKRAADAAAEAARAAASARADSSDELVPRGPRKVLVVTGQMPFADDQVLNALESPPALGEVELSTVQFNGSTTKPVEAALARDTYDAICVVGLGSGSSFVPRNPTKPFPASGPLRDALVAFVQAGGVLLFTGERAAAHTISAWFNKTWAMEGDYYRRTDHSLNPEAHAAYTLLAAQSKLRKTPPGAINVKACMLTGVPREEQLYAASAGAVTQSLVFAPIEVQPGSTAVAVAPHGDGWVAFIGDVNYEPPTIEILIQILLGLRPRVSL